MDADELKNMTPQEILELQKKNCIFCKIIAKEIPAFEVYSDEKVSVILDINPANEGHCLVLPKTHYQILPQIPDDMIGYMFRTAKNTSRALLKSLAVQGTTIFVANGALAGQKAPHFMAHVVPRKPGDMLFTVPKHAIEESKVTELREKLYTYLNGKPLKQISDNDGIIEHKEQKKKQADEPANEGHETRFEEKKKIESPEENDESIDDDKSNEDEHHVEKPKEDRSNKKKPSMNIDDIADMFL